MAASKGRTAKGRLKKGYRLLKGGRVVKAGTRRATRKRNPVRKRRAAAAPVRRRRAASVARPKRRNPVTPRRRQVTVAAKRRTRRSPAPARKRRTYRRNQPQMRRLTRDLQEGVVGAFQVVSGKAAARVVPEMFGIPSAGLQGLAIQAGVALLVGMFGRQIFGVKAGQMLTIGALTAPVETVIIQANIPFISGGLSAYPTLGAYVNGAGVPGQLTPGGSMDAYPQDVTIGEYYGEQQQQYS